MWSVHYLSARKPACASRSVLSKAVFSLSRMIFVNTFPGMDSSTIPLQLLQDNRSPFFGSFMRWPFYQSSGTLSCFQILYRSGCSISVEIRMSPFSASGGMPSGPATLPDLRDLMALVTSALVGGLMLMSRS